MSSVEASRLRTAVDWNVVNAPVAAGRALLLISGLVVTGSVSALSPSSHDWAVIVAVSAAMVTLLIASVAMPWSRLRPSAAFAFPIALCGGLAALGGYTNADIGSCYTGLFVLGFVYVGVYFPLHSSFVLVPVAAPCLVAALDRWDAYIAVRLAIATAIWLILGEVLGLLTQHHHHLTQVLRDAARIDALTGVGNRRDLDVRISATDVGDTVVICDLDHFKLVNDTFGHAHGDEVLREFGAVLKGALRGDDYAGRYGGEEFVLVLADTDDREAGEVLQRLRRKWLMTGQAITFSAGYQTRQSDDTPLMTLAAADAALYTAKRTGRDRVVNAAGQTQGAR